MEIPPFNPNRRHSRFVLLIAVLFTAAFLACVPQHAMMAQNQPAMEPTRATPHVFEDEDVKILIPAGWAMSESAADAQPFLRVGRHLQLTKDGYILTLAYKTEPAGGPAIDRFAQIFPASWLAAANTESCGFSLRRNQRPVSATLLFIGLLMDTADAKVRSNCGLKYNIEARWYAGFFTVPNGGYYLHSSGPGCTAEDKVYTLTPQAKSAEALPNPEDPDLRAIIGDAGRIVNTIQYKRCPLASGRASNLN
jgi:hypothetical protein